MGNNQRKYGEEMEDLWLTFNKNNLGGQKVMMQERKKIPKAKP